MCQLKMDREHVASPGAKLPSFFLIVFVIGLYYVNGSWKR